MQWKRNSGPYPKRQNGKLRCVRLAITWQWLSHGVCFWELGLFLRVRCRRAPSQLSGALSKSTSIHEGSLGLKQITWPNNMAAVNATLCRICSTIWPSRKIPVSPALSVASFWMTMYIPTVVPSMDSWLGALFFCLQSAQSQKDWNEIKQNRLNICTGNNILNLCVN